MWHERFSVLTDAGYFVIITNKGGRTKFIFCSKLSPVEVCFPPPFPAGGELLPCNKPLRAVELGLKDNGKKQLLFLKPLDDLKWPADKIIDIPCGQCIGCRLDYSREWADRCMLELQYHQESWFVTLTYDDDHVPWTCFKPTELGEVDPRYMVQTLCKRDFQLFMKRLRKQTGQKLRFYMCGEYGGQTARPHYHVIIFGLHLDDLTLYKKSKLGFSYWNSETLERAWSDERGKIGHVVVAEVTWESCAYTARYMMKKLKGADSAYYDEANIQPEFTLMSRKPGIARQYYDDHPDLYETERIVISTEKGGRVLKPPRYYDRLYDVDAPDQMALVKQKRKFKAMASEDLRMQRTSLSKGEYLCLREDKKKDAIKGLIRPLESEVK